jgi:hypothetical protein
MFSNLFPEKLLALTLLVSSLPLSFASPVEARSGSVCSTGLYKDLLFLELYPPAETWCSAHYPPSVVTKTASAKKKRYLPTITVTATVTVTVKSSATDSPGGVLFAWLQAHEFLEPVRRQATTPRPTPTYVGAISSRSLAC